MRAQLVRPDRAQLAGDDGYRFRHLLIRDAAYDALPKAVRADLHARFADWLDEHGHALVERDEIVGYHLEQAARYHAELGQPDPALAERAAMRLAAAGRRASDRLDGRRARASDPGGRAPAPASARPRARARGRMAIVEVDGRAAVQAADAVAERAEAAGDRSGAMLARAMALFLRVISGDARRRRAGGALPRSAALRGGAGRSPAARAALVPLAYAANFRMQNDDERCRLRAGAPTSASPATPRGRGAGLTGRSSARARRTRRCGCSTRSRPGRPRSTGLGRAVLLAMLGRFDEAWPLAEARSDHLREVTGDMIADEHLAA